MVHVIFAPYLLHDLLYLARSYDPYEKNRVAEHPAYHGMNQLTGLNSNDGQLRRASLATGLHAPYIQKYQPRRSPGTRTQFSSDQLVTDLHQLQYIGYYPNANNLCVQFN